MCRAVNKISIPEPVIFSTGRRNGYNMTSLNGVNIYRYHDADWKTKLAIDDGNGVAKDIRFPSECDEYSLEDARLFTHKGSLHISYTCARTIDGMFRSIQAYGPLEFSGSQWEVKSHIVPKIKGNDFSGMQKNYVPFEIGNKLHFIFGISGQRQIVHELIGDKVVTTYESEAPKWNWGEIRGGAIAKYKDHLLRIFHSRIGGGHKNYDFRYYIGAALMEKEPPFRTVAVSSFPVLAGNERYVDCSHWKPNCCLPYGMETDGTSVKISGGINDCESFTMTLSGGDLHL